MVPSSKQVVASCQLPPVKRSAIFRQGLCGAGDLSSPGRQPTETATYCSAALQGLKKTKLGLREFVRLGAFVQKIDTEQHLAVSDVT